MLPLCITGISARAEMPYDSPVDLLERYKQQHPEAFREQKPAPMRDEYGRVYTGMVAFVIRLSGGAIRDTRQAHLVLLGTAIIFGLATLLFFFGIPGGSTSTQPNLINP